VAALALNDITPGVVMWTDSASNSKTAPAAEVGFYRAMHFSAKRGIAIVCRLSVRPSVCDVGGL